MSGESGLPVEFLQIVHEPICVLTGVLNTQNEPHSSTEEFSEGSLSAVVSQPPEENDEVEILESGHGGVLLIHNGHLYRRKSKSERYSTSCWLCTMAGCPVKASLYGLSGLFRTNKEEHNHPQRYDYIREKKLMFQLSTMAQNSKEPASVIVASLGIQKNPEKYISYVKNLRGRKRQPKLGSRRTKQSIRVGLDYQVVPSARNKAMIVRDGYVYRQNVVRSVGPNLYWRCNVNSCKATAKTTETTELEITNPNHSHPPEAESLINRVTMNTMKDAAKDLTRPLVEIFAEFGVKDPKTKKFLRYVRSTAEKEEEKSLDDPVVPPSPEKATALPVVSPPLDLPPEILDLSSSDLNDPSNSFEQTPLEKFASSLNETTAEISAEHYPEPHVAELKEIYTMEELLQKMDEQIL